MNTEDTEIAEFDRLVMGEAFGEMVENALYYVQHKGVQTSQRCLGLPPVQGSPN